MRALRPVNNVRMNRAEKIIAAILPACCLLLAGCGAGGRTLSNVNRTTTTTETAAPAPAATVVHAFDAQPYRTGGGEDLLIPASLSVEDTAVILAEREGRVVKLQAQEGARVAKGQVLAEFNDDDQRSQLRQAEIEVSRLKVEEQQYEALVKLNRSELERETTLAREGITSKSNVERAQYKLEQSTHEYEKTRLATRSAQERIRAVQLAVEKGIVRAPISGIVTRRYVTLGTNVSANEKLFEVSKLTPLMVKFQLPQAEAVSVAPGQAVALSSVAGNRIIASARIRRVDPVADATSSTIGYLAEVSGGARLMPGLTVNVRIPRPPDSPAFWIPRSAFPASAEVRAGAPANLFVVEGDRVSARIVLVARVEGDQTEVVSGLNPNDRVVLLPPDGLKDGDIVVVSTN